MTDMNFFHRPIAITDLEMTGLDPHRHEIIEIGLVVVRQPDLEIIDTMEVKVKPEHVKTADPEAIKVPGYTAELWKDALPLRQALEHYVEKTKDAIFCSQVVTVDWAFLVEGFEKMGIQHSMDYHQIDIPSLSWLKLRHAGIDKVRLARVSEYLGLPVEPKEHRAINGAMGAYHILKKFSEPS